MTQLMETTRKQTRKNFQRVEQEDDSAAIMLRLGGSGDCGEGVIRACPEFADRSLAIDTDIRQGSTANSVSQQIHLNADGNIPTILEHPDNYGLTAEGALPSRIAAWEIRQGVGMVRFGATIVSAAELPRITSTIRRLIESTLSRLKGRRPKKLNVHLIFSTCGGTGSALATLVACLVRSIVASVNPTLSVTITGHAIGPGVFWSRLSTPGEQQRAYANAAMTLKEIFFAQNPENLNDLCQALGISPIRDQLLNHLDFYEISSSGDTVIRDEEIGHRIAANIIGSQSRLVQHLENSRDVNRATAQFGVEQDHGGTAIIGTEFTTIARIPIQGIAESCAARELLLQSERVLGASDASRVTSLHERHLPELKLQASQRAIKRELKGAGSCAVQDLADVNVREALETIETRQRQWTQHGQTELRHLAGMIQRRMERSVPLRVTTFARRIADGTSRLADFEAVLRRAVSSVQEVIIRVRARLEDLSSSDPLEEFQEKLALLQDGRYSWLFRRGHLQELQTLWNQYLDLETETAALTVFLRAMLEPMQQRLELHVESAGLIEKQLTAARHDLSVRVNRTESDFGWNNEFFTEVVAPDEVRGVLERIIEDVTGRFGSAPGLKLAPLLEADEPQKLQELLEEQCERRSAQVEVFLREARDVRDIDGFIRHYGLSLNLKRWLANAADFTLPAKLNRAVHGPAHSPIRACVVMPAALRSMWDETVAEVNTPAEFEFQPSDDPFEIIVRARIARTPFSSIPGLEEMERHYQAFLKQVPKTRSDGTANVWGYLNSTLLLKGAEQVRLLPVSSRRAADAAADLDDVREEDATEEDTATT